MRASWTLRAAIWRQWLQMVAPYPLHWWLLFHALPSHPLLQSPFPRWLPAHEPAPVAQNTQCSLGISLRMLVSVMDSCLHMKYDLVRYHVAQQVASVTATAVRRLVAEPQQRVAAGAPNGQPAGVPSSSTGQSTENEMTAIEDDRLTGKYSGGSAAALARPDQSFATSGVPPCLPGLTSCHWS